jgi:hypothetical protein
MRCCLYVGSTGLTSEARLARHFDPPPGWRSTVVTHCGGFLREDLSAGLVFPTKAEAESAELSLYAYLKQQGYTTFGPRIHDLL